MDGTCDEQGRLTALISIDAEGPQWLTISCRLAGLEQPSQVAARLPKALIHDNVPGHRIHDLLTDMDRAWHAAPRWGARQRWIAMAGALQQTWQVRDGVTRWRLGRVHGPVGPGGVRLRRTELVGVPRDEPCPNHFGMFRCP